MRTNRIVELNLESRIRDLIAEEKSEREIASILSTETNQKITQSSVHRYLAVRDKIRQEAIQKNHKLIVKAAEVELDTIEARHELIKEIRDLADKAKDNGDLKTALSGLDKAIAALDSLDKRLGRFSGKPGQPDIQMNVHINQQVANFMNLVLNDFEEEPDVKARIKERIKSRLEQLINS